MATPVMLLRRLLTDIVLGLFLLLPLLGGAQAQSAPQLMAGQIQSSAGAAVVIPIRFMPAPDDGADGGPDAIASLQFTLDFTGLQFDATDVNPEDGIPDAIVFNPNGVAELDFFAPIVINADTAANDGFLDLVITDPTRMHVLPTSTLMTIALQIPPEASPGQIQLRLSNVAAKDDTNVLQSVDVIDGAVTVSAGVTPSATATATPTPSSPPPPTLSPSHTPLPTNTPATPTVTPPPGCFDVQGGVICHQGEEGGCAIAPAARGPWFPVVFGGLLILWRRLDS
jgi:hypothetical protein